MRAAPRPTNISTKLEPEAAKKSTPAWAATARASIVLPVPGGPWRRTPRGAWAPRAAKRSGSRSQAATSISSSLAASTPCTSSQRTGSVWDAFTVSGLVVPIIPRVIFRKTKQQDRHEDDPEDGIPVEKEFLHVAWPSMQCGDKRAIPPSHIRPNVPKGLKVVPEVCRNGDAFRYLSTWEPPTMASSPESPKTTQALLPPS